MLLMVLFNRLDITKERINEFKEMSIKNFQKPNPKTKNEKTEQNIQEQRNNLKRYNVCLGILEGKERGKKKNLNNND